MSPKFIIIPDKTPDLRTCITRRWAGGVDVQISALRLRPVSVVRDGSDGAFALTAEVNASNNEIALRLHHVSAAGVASAPVLLASNSNVWFYSGFLVPSTPGSCVAVWTYGGWGGTLQAQRFDTNGNALWASPIALSTTSHGFAYVAAASDGRGGAFVAFRENASDVAATQSFRVQQVTVTGALPWGGSGTSIVAPGTSQQIPYGTPRIAVGLSELAVIWEGWNLSPGGAQVFCAWVDVTGQMQGTPFAVGTTWEIPTMTQRWAIADPDGGFYVALQPVAASLKLLRFDSRSTTPRWTAITAQTPSLMGSYSLAEDGAGGALLATLGMGARVSVARYDRQGVNQWASAAAANVATVTLAPATGTSSSFEWLGPVAVAAKVSGGAILVYTDWPQPAAPRLHSQCFDDSGALFGRDNAVAQAPGSQQWPLLADMVVPAVQPPVLQPQPFPRPPSPRPPLPHRFPPPDPEAASIICLWRGPSGASGTAIIAQKLGCCRSTYGGSGTVVVVPELGCAVPIDWPKNLPGTINAIFPCGRPGGSFGLLPVPHLAVLDSANLPGGLATASVPVPDWVRMWFEHLPPTVRIELRSHKNEVIAAATSLSLPPGIEQRTGRTSTLTFRPHQKLSYVLVFSRPKDAGAPAMVPIGVRMEFGSGDAPPVSTPTRAPGAPRGAARPAARSAGAQSKTPKKKRKK